MFLISSLGVISLLLSLLLTPFVRDHIGPLGFMDIPDGGRKRHAAPRPRVGGIAIALSFVLTFAIALMSPFSYVRVVRAAMPDIEKLILPGVLVLITGLLDDWFGFKAWQKLAGIFAAAALAVSSGFHVDIHWLAAASSHPWLQVAISILWLIGCTNAFNLIDGMDGLASGVGLFAAGTMFLAAAMQGNLPLMLAVAPLMGSLLGFLRYNFHPATVFLGDSGSLLLGFLLGCYGALWSQKSVTVVAITVPLLAFSVPLVDVVLSILRRFLRARPIFEGDRGHIHHKLLDLGLSPKVAVFSIYGFCAVAAVFSLLAGALHDEFHGLIVVLFYGLVWVMVQTLGYVEFATAGRIFMRGGFQKVIDAEMRLNEFSTKLAKSKDIIECWTRIVEGSKEFGFRGVRMRLAGRIWEDSVEQASSKMWQLRIPLGDEQYINFVRDFHFELNPTLLNAF